MKKIFFLLLFLPIFVNAQQDSARRDTLILDKLFNCIGKTIDVKKFHFGISLSSGLFPMLLETHYQKKTPYYGGGLIVNYQKSKKYSINFDASLLDFTKYYEILSSYYNLNTNQFAYILYKMDSKFIMLTADINFKYNFLRRKFYYYFRTGLEITSITYRNVDAILERSDTTFHYITPYTLREQLTSLFHFSENNLPDVTRLGILFSPGINFTPFKKINSFAELEIKFYPDRFIEMNSVKKLLFGIKLGIII